MPVACRKETFRWQLVANREVSGSPEVTKSSHLKNQKAAVKAAVWVGLACDP